MKMKYIISEENAAEIKEYRKSVKEKYLDRRLHALQLLGEGVKPKDIAEKLDVDKRQISVWAKSFCERGGIEGFIKKRGGRHHENMSLEQERQFVEQFTEKLEKGQITVTGEIREAYEKLVGHKVHPKQIYNVLHRHDWKKVVPKSRRPKKAAEEVIEASKN